MEKNSSSPVAATPASVNTTPDKPKTASEHRKSSKPIMEKRRRARINESLSQLKTLILDALKKDSSRHSKLEKADILEMTVKHLRNLQRAQMTAALSSDPSVLGKYRAGFSECMNEVTRFLSTCEGVNAEVRTRLLGHLANCMTQINAMTYPGQPQPRPTATSPSSSPAGPSRTAARSSPSTPAAAAPPPPWVPTRGPLPAGPRSLRTPCGGPGGTEGRGHPPTRPPAFHLPSSRRSARQDRTPLGHWDRKRIFFFCDLSGSLVAVLISKEQSYFFFCREP